MFLPNTLIDDVRLLARHHVKTYGDLLDGPTDVRAVAKALGIYLRSHPFPQDREFRGALYIDDDDFRLIVVNKLLPPGQWMFTVAHEIGHVALEHRGARQGWQEHAANVYAAELLMPADRMRNLVRQHGRDLFTLAAANCVSFQALRSRLEELGLAG